MIIVFLSVCLSVCLSVDTKDVSFLIQAFLLVLNTFKCDVLFARYTLTVLKIMCLMGLVRSLHSSEKCMEIRFLHVPTLLRYTDWVY